MARINENFLKLPGSYLFSEIARRVNEFKQQNPQANIIRMGIGDVTQPLVPEVIKTLHKATDEMAHHETFRGYGPEQGYEFLRQTVVDNDFTPRGVQISPDEIFISDGAKSDLGNIGDILSTNNVVALTDPVYPVYVDTNVMGGRSGNLQSNGAWSNLVTLPCTPENNFTPELPSKKVDIIYLCYPNNPTGTTLTHSELKRWVDYARIHESLILFDAAYEAYISEENVPHSIYEIDGAKEVAIEFRSFSKTAGFTGLRCGYTVVPKELEMETAEGKKIPLNNLWNRRQTTKFNGTAYIIQRAAEAVYSAQGKVETKATIEYYMQNAALLLTGLKRIGFEVYGGINAPYIWVKTPKGLSSWDFFDKLLADLNIVGTPGVGFGRYGEGFFRFTAFGQRKSTEEAVERIQSWKI